MPFGLDVGAVGERETHAPKNLDRAVEHLGERMKRAEFAGVPGKRDVDVGQRARFFRARKLSAALLDRGGHGVARFVQQLADERTLFLAERFHLFAPGGDAAGASEITDADGFERLLVGRRGDFAQARRRAVVRAGGTWER